MVESLTLGSVTFRQDNMAVAWNLWVLWGSGDSRGQNKVIPGVPGTRALPFRPTSTSYTIPIAVSGEVTPAGVATALDVTDQAARNIAYLVSTLVTGGLVGALVTIGTATRSGSVQVKAITPSDGGPGWVRADMTIEIPAGRLA